MRISSRHKNSSRLIKSKETMNTMNSFPISWLNYTEKHSNGRQNTSAKRKRTLTADRVPDAAGWCTLMADRVPATTAEILSRPTECLLPLNEVLSRPIGCFRNRMKYSLGRQNASAIGWSTLTADKMPASIGWSTLTADRMLPRLEITL